MEQQDLYTEYRKHLKERILTVAMQAFKQHGIRNVRMDDIATTLAIQKERYTRLTRTRKSCCLMA